jgi:hypothetical protein
MAIDSMEHEGTAADMNRIPKAGWRLAARNGTSARDYLITLLGNGMSRGEEIGEMVRSLEEGTL